MVYMKRFAFILALIALFSVLTVFACAEVSPNFVAPDWVSSAFKIPDTISVIEEEAFSGDDSLTQVSIPANVVHIGADAFASCPNITRIAVFSRNVILDHNSLGTLNEVKEIWGPANSTAQAYAKAYGYTFTRIPIDAQDLLEYADSKLGTKYIRGTWDCVLFVRNCYKTVFGITVPDSCTAMQNLSANSTFLKQGLTATKITSIDALMPGDIICWRDESHSYCTHVGIYVGHTEVDGIMYTDGTFIENSNSKGNVRYNNFDKNKISASYTPYYIRYFMYAWRIL